MSTEDGATLVFTIALSSVVMELCRVVMTLARGNRHVQLDQLEAALTTFHDLLEQRKKEVQ
jgi:hypothetical protein